MTEISEEFDYFIGANCIICGKCRSVCPQKCIDLLKRPVMIDQSRCIHCGECEKICPVGAVDKRD
ncbi:MAG: 4Fe-4S binding protein [Blautia sp.]|nr:4Fe-4S binding protein [Blautia sp.]